MRIGDKKHLKTENSTFATSVTAALSSCFVSDKETITSASELHLQDRCVCALIGGLLTACSSMNGTPAHTQKKKKGNSSSFFFFALQFLWTPSKMTGVSMFFFFFLSCTAFLDLSSLCVVLLLITLSGAAIVFVEGFFLFSCLYAFFFFLG